MTDGVDQRSEQRVADLYEQYAPFIAAYALRRASSTDAADVVAETFLVAWRRREIMPEEPKTLPWLCGVARRVLANQRRSQRRRGRLNDRLQEQFSRHGTPAPFDETEDFQRVACALAKLSDDDAELLRLIAWEGLTPSEVATAMELAPGTARQRISRARQRLQKHLDRDGYEADVNGSVVADETCRPPATRRKRPRDTLLYGSTREGWAQ